MCQSYIDSKTNKVILARNKDSFVARKCFKEKLLTYDVYWPITRAYVERDLYDFLGVYFENNNFVKVPKVIDFDETGKELVTEYIKGMTLFELLKADADEVAYPDLEAIRQLIITILDFKNITKDMLGLKLCANLKKQYEIVECMYKNKHNGAFEVLPHNSDRSVLCHGDLSLHNIIFKNNTFYIIDMECAHFGYEGYDLGQLFGMMDACMDTKLKRLILEAYEGLYKDGIIGANADNNIQSFRNSFSRYYLKDFDTNNH